MKQTIFLLILFILISGRAYSQAGMRYSDFATKLERYFHPDLIADIGKELSKLDYTVWSWDVGDFSGDGHNDVAFSIRKTGGKDKIMDVYLFSDINGYLVKVGEFSYKYVALPLEVGVAIRNGAVYITQKFKEFNWNITSYLLNNGSLIKNSNYTTENLGKLTHEREVNYYNLRNFERYVITRTGKHDFFADYFTIPSYNRSRFIYKGISAAATVKDIEFCPTGAYWWTGASDLCFNVSSAFDDMFLYFTVNVTDDAVMKPYSDIKNGEALELWLDPNDYAGNRFITSDSADKNIMYRKVTTDDLYKVEISVGDFVNKEPTMTLITQNGNSKMMEKMNENVVCDLTDNGYYVIFKLPFRALAVNTPFIVNDFMRWGATMRVFDIDNEFRPEQHTVLQTSLFEEGNPSSFGNIVFAPADQWYGETSNVYLKQIISALEEFGF